MKSIYTATVTLPEGRTFTLDEREHTRESHTEETVAEIQLKSMSRVGFDQYSAVWSDNTDNTRVCRQIICEQNPKILKLPDPWHLINNTIQDISILSCFQKPLG